MQKRVFLHVGLPKSGTTYLQAILSANKPQLLERAALLYPGETWSDQVRAVRDVRKMRSPRGRDQRRKMRGAWERLADEINGFPGDAIVSMEWLCRAEPDQINKILQDLRPATVEVIFTQRDLGRTIPAAWQESIQNRAVWSWAEFVDGIAAEDPLSTHPGRSFWALHDAEQLLARWAKVVPAERLHLITLPPPGGKPTVLWERVCEVLDIDGSGYVVEGLTGNESLGLESVEIIRMLNPRARAAGITRSVHDQLVTRNLAKRGLSRRKSDESRLGIPPERYDWVRARAAEEVAGIQALQVDVVGNLADLTPNLAAGEDYRQPDEVGPAALLDAAIDGLVILVQQREALMQRVLEGQEKLAAEHAAELKRLAKQNARLAKRNTQLAKQNTQLEGRRAKLRRRVNRLESHPFRAALEVYTHRRNPSRGVLRRGRRLLSPLRNSGRPRSETTRKEPQP